MNTPKPQRQQKHKTKLGRHSDIDRLVSAQRVPNSDGACFLKAPKAPHHLHKPPPTCSGGLCHHLPTQGTSASHRCSWLGHRQHHQIPMTQTKKQQGLAESEVRRSLLGTRWAGGEVPQEHLFLGSPKPAHGAEAGKAGEWCLWQQDKDRHRHVLGLRTENSTVGGTVPQSLYKCRAPRSREVEGSWSRRKWSPRGWGWAPPHTNGSAGSGFQ